MRCVGANAPAIRAPSALQTHQLGSELVLEVQGLLSRSQVCRSRDEPRRCEQWRAVMVEAGRRE